MFFAIIQGIIEGVTEFLPVSSTAHLLIAAKYLQIPQTAYWKFFEVFIQGAAILAIVISFPKELFNKKLWPKILIGFLPTAVIGFLLYEIIKSNFFANYFLIAGSLILISLLFLLVEYLINKKKLILNKNLESLNYKDAFLLGVTQSLAVIPGVSRAGIVLVAGLFLGYKREEVALYSFLLAAPTILAASGFDLIKTDKNLLLQNLPLTLIGSIFSFIFAYLAVNWFVKYLQKNNLIGFAAYRLLLGSVLLLTILYT